METISSSSVILFASRSDRRLVDKVSMPYAVYGFLLHFIAIGAQFMSSNRSSITPMDFWPSVTYIALVVFAVSVWMRSNLGLTMVSTTIRFLFLGVLANGLFGDVWKYWWIEGCACVGLLFICSRLREVYVCSIMSLLCGFLP